MPNIFTVDVEDWFHLLDFEDTKTPQNWLKFESRVEKSTKEILDILERYEVKGTFFVLGWVAQHYPELIKNISDYGHEIACHSNNHQLVYDLRPKEFYADTLAALEAINSACGKWASVYRAPGFSITEESDWAFDVLIDLGISIDCSVFPAVRAHGGMPTQDNKLPFYYKTPTGRTIIELPISFTKILGKRVIFSGGGYFRILPYFLIKYLMNRANYNMTYFHPRDIDGDQPVLENLTRFRKFKSYVGVRHGKYKLERLLKDFKFVSVEKYVKIKGLDINAK